MCRFREEAIEQTLCQIADCGWANVILRPQNAGERQSKLEAIATQIDRISPFQPTWIGSGQQPIINIITIIKFIVIGRNRGRPKIGVVAELV